MLKTILILVGSGVLIASSIVHGLWTDRWSDGLDLVAAGESLETIPTKIGVWESTPMTLEDPKKYSLAGSLGRSYLNTSTGVRVTLYLANGRPGPVSIHTPEICFAANGYKVEEQKVHAMAPSSKSGPEFFTARMTKKDNASQNILRIFWGWREGTRWRTADNPRLAFAGEKILHKMYVIREMAHAGEAAETDPCLDFLKELLPVLERKLVNDQKA